MKRIRIYALTVLCIVMSSCTEDLLQDNLTGEQNLTSVTLKAKGEISSDTKAAYVNYPKIAWQEKDKISVLGIQTGNQEFITAAAGHIVNFSGKADMSDEEFYAVYPYDENITLNADGTLANVTIPAIQTATANNFDPNAYIAIAKSTDKESLEFKSIGAFVKLNFQNFTSSVKSVTLVSNSGMTMAGTASSTTLNNDGSTSHSSVNSETASTRVKLQGTFDLSKGYFVIVRPDSYESGITIYVELEDGRVLSRKGNSALFEQDKSRNYIRPIILNAKYFKEATDLYTLYEMGYNVEVAGKVISKATHGDTELISENKELTAATRKVYFVAPEATLTYNVTGNVSDLVILGTDASKRSNMIASAQFKLATTNAGNFILSGLNITGGAYNFFTVNENGTYPYVAFDNCKIDMGTNKKPIYYMSSAERTIGTFVMQNCDFKASGDTQYIIQFGGASTKEYANITLKNNIFYSSEMNGAKAFNVIGNGGSTPVGTLTLEQNTFANVYPATNYITLKSVANYTVTNNLFYLDKYNEVYENPYTNILSCKPDAHVGAGADNYLFKDADNARLRIYIKDGDYTLFTATKSTVVTGEVDLTVPTIVPATTAGATR